MRVCDRKCAAKPPLHTQAMLLLHTKADMCDDDDVSIPFRPRECECGKGALAVCSKVPKRLLKCACSRVLSRHFLVENQATSSRTYKDDSSGGGGQVAVIGARRRQLKGHTYIFLTLLCQSSTMHMLANSPYTHTHRPHTCVQLSPSRRRRFDVFNCHFSIVIAGVSSDDATLPPWQSNSYRIAGQRRREAASRAFQLSALILCTRELISTPHTACDCNFCLSVAHYTQRASASHSLHSTRAFIITR